jgi:hypothetical protein
MVAGYSQALFAARKDNLKNISSVHREDSHRLQITLRITITKPPSGLLFASNVRTARFMVASFPFLCIASPNKNKHPSLVTANCVRCQRSNRERRVAKLTTTDSTKS